MFSYPVAGAAETQLVGPEAAFLTAEEDMISVDIGDANIKIQRDAKSGGQLLLVGSGWVNQAGSGSTITIKLNHLRGGEVVQYQRGGEDTGVYSEDDIIAHPKSGKKDSTIFWQFHANSDGSFEVVKRLPLHLEKGQMLKLNVASGLVDGDISRSTVSPSLRVEGEQWQEPENTKPECHPTTTPPSVTVATEPDSKNRLHVEGRGFCNTKGGGARVAIKIDDAKVKHVEAYKVHENGTIWQIVNADDLTGDFSVDVQLPDGTLDGPYGTAKPFKEGEHTLRVLSGSLQEGDTRISLPQKGDRLPFVIGSYKPSGVPDPLSYVDDLVKAAQGGITVTKEGEDVVVTVAGGEEGDWVYVNAYIEDGSPRLPWADTWFQLDAEGKARLPQTEDIPDGPLKVTVQDGNQGKYGELLGWDSLVYKAKPAEDEDEDDAGSDSTTDTSTKKKKEKLSDVASLGAELNSLASQIGRLEKAATEGESKSHTKTQAIEETVSAEGSESTRVRRVVKRVVRRGGGASTTGGNATVQRGSGGSTVKKKPQHSAEPPASNAKGFDSSNAHDASGSFKDDILRVKLPKLKTGQWANLFVYPKGSDSKPVDAGWVQVDSKGRVRLDTSGLPDGDYIIAAADAKDNMAGWIEITLGDGTAEQSPEDQFISGSQPEDSGSDTAEPRYVRSGMMTSLDWWLIGASALIPLLSGAALAFFRRRL